LFRVSYFEAVTQPASLGDIYMRFLKRFTFFVIFYLAPLNVVASSDCIDMLVDVDSEVEETAIESLFGWDSYDDIERVSAYLSGMIVFFEACKSNVPEFSVVDGESFFIHWDIDSINGALNALNTKLSVVYKAFHFETLRPQIISYSLNIEKGLTPETNL